VSRRDRSRHAEGTLHRFRAHQVILATVATAAPVLVHLAHTCTGDGGAWCCGGLPLQDMEFVQFHPTAFTRRLPDHGRVARRGGYLTNSDGDRFMERYAPMPRTWPRAMW